MRQRLDIAMVARGIVNSRSRARDLVQRGLIRVDGGTMTRPAAMVAEAQTIDMEPGADRWVARSALKLIAALEAFGFSPVDRIALDIGASTGGFTQVLLDRGALQVYAVDVGHGQLHASLLENPGVHCLSGTDARDLSDAIVPEPFTAITADVSFISLTLTLPRALERASPGCWLAALIKPQFEAGREHIGKGGIVRDPAAHNIAIERVRTFLAAQRGWAIEGIEPSPIEGGSGNKEFLLGARYEP